MTLATSAGATPPRCSPGQSVYQGAGEPDFELEFFRDFTAKTPLLKSGVMRIHLKTGVLDYDVLTGWSKKYARPDITVRRSASRSRGDDSSRGAGPGPLLMFDEHLRPHRGTNAPQVLVMDDISASFFYWWDEIERAFSGDRIVPPYTFKLVRCRDERQRGS